MIYFCWNSYIYISAEKLKLNPTRYLWGFFCYKYIATISTGHILPLSDFSTFRGFYSLGFSCQDLYLPPICVAKTLHPGNVQVHILESLLPWRAALPSLISSTHLISGLGKARLTATLAVFIQTLEEFRMNSLKPLCWRAPFPSTALQCVDTITAGSKPPELQSFCYSWRRFGDTELVFSFKNQIIAPR